MADKIYINSRFCYREDTFENWQKFNPVLLGGEIAFVRDGANGQFVKIGDGVTPWNELPFAPLPKGEKGDNGNDYVLTPEDIENIANLAKPIPDQTYSPTSENAQSGKAVAEALKSKVLVDVTLTEEQASAGIKSISVAIEDIEAYFNAKQVNVYVEMPFKEKALSSSYLCCNVGDSGGQAYSDYLGYINGVSCPQGNTLIWCILNIRHSFTNKSSSKETISFFASPSYYGNANSLGTARFLYGEVTNLSYLKSHPPVLKLYWASGGETFEAGTRLFAEVYE